MLCATSTDILTFPWVVPLVLVNFMALLHKLYSTWRTLTESPLRLLGISGAIDKSSSRWRFLATDDNTLATSSSVSATENGTGSILSFPASILEKSKISSKILNNENADSRIIVLKRCWAPSSSV